MNQKQLAILCAACLPATLCWPASSTTVASPVPSLSISRVATGLSHPVYATYAPGDDQRLYILEQHTGDIRVLNPTTGQLNTSPFLNVGGLSLGREQGLLGMAFHPQYEYNGVFYVSFTDAAGDIVIDSYRRQSNDMADVSSRRRIMTIDQTGSTNVGGWIGFGRSYGLFIAVGDGGDSPQRQSPGSGTAQDMSSLLGKILRIDVNADQFPGDASKNYGILPSNPFTGRSGAAGEIWAYGLRNPRRNSFDRLTGDFYITDDGQHNREEINVLSNEFGLVSGIDFGWPRREGTSAATGSFGGETLGAINPTYEYSRGNGPFDGSGITGGYVYRGPIEELRGQYFFADYFTDGLWSAVIDTEISPVLFDGTIEQGVTRWNERLRLNCGGESLCGIDSIVSFGEDLLGNLYLVDDSGQVFRIDSYSNPEPASGLLALFGGLGWLTIAGRARSRGADRG